MRKCLYCHSHKRIGTRHVGSCCFNPTNNRKIINFLKDLVLNNQSFTVVKYDKFAQDNKCPVGKTILDLLIVNRFIPSYSNTRAAFIYLVYRSYELNLIEDLEILDILVYKLTFGMYGLSYVEYSKRAEQIATKSGVTLDEINMGYETLAYTILNNIRI